MSAEGSSHKIELEIYLFLEKQIDFDRKSKIQITIFVSEQLLRAYSGAVVVVVTLSSLEPTNARQGNKLMRIGKC